MKVSPINYSTKNTAFSGHYVKTYNPLTLEQTDYWHKNSTVEKTLDSYHTNQSNYAYFAEPLEPVSDLIKERVDYVVYDNEPAYPDIDEVSTNYFGRLRKNFKEMFEEVRLYFYRREMGGFANVEEAKDKQREAAECTRMYDAAGDLRYQKERAEDVVQERQEEKIRLTRYLADTTNELSDKVNTKDLIEKHTANLTKLKKTYQELIKSSEASAPNEEALSKKLKDDSHIIPYVITDEHTKNKKQLSDLETSIQRLEKLREESIKTIQSLKARISGIKANIEQTEAKIESTNAFIDECKAKLIPLFDELKNFYAQRGIKGVKGL